MPEISRFYGIIIKMFFKPKGHEPAHIHALYEKSVGVFDIHTYEMVPSKEQHLVQEWLRSNATELVEMWNTQQLHKLPPLE